MCKGTNVETGFTGPCGRGAEVKDHLGVKVAHRKAQTSAGLEPSVGCEYHDAGGFLWIVILLRPLQQPPDVSTMTYEADKLKAKYLRVIVRASAPDT
eukprot:377885-Prorocentrum_minimum.AAC.2